MPTTAIKLAGVLALVVLMGASSGISTDQARTAGPGPVTNGASAAEGSSISFSRADHAHSTSGFPLPGSCPAGQFETADNAGGAPSCAAPAGATPAGSSGDLQTNSGAGGLAAYAGAACSGSLWLKSLTTAGTSTCTQIDWSDVSGKPAMFAPSAHTHVATTDLTATGTKTSATFLRGDDTWNTPPAQDWSVITGKPATFPASVPVSSATALAGTPAACTGSLWMKSFTSTGVTTCTQPAYSDISGTPAAYSLPDAAAGVKGGLELDTDLGGTAAAPQVVATHLALPLPGAQGGGGAALPTCSGTDKLTSNGTIWICAADVGGGGGGGNFVRAVVDFGAGDTLVTTTVSASWVSASSKIVCNLDLTQATADRGAGDEDALLEGIVIAPANLNAGVGFDLVAHAPNDGASGQFSVNCGG